MVVEVIIDIKVNKLNKVFDYLVPSKYESIIKKGIRVLVPFGNIKKIGFIINIKDNSSFSKLKEIIELIDYEPLINEELFQLSDYLINNYNNIPSQVYNLFYPKSIKSKIIKKYYLNSNNKEVIDLYNKFTKDIKSFTKNDFKDFNNYLNKNKIISKDILEKNNPLKLVKFLKINSNKDYSSLKDYQKEIIAYLKENNDISKKELALKYSISKINTLIKNEYIQEYDKEVYREIKNDYKYDNKDVKLNKEQELCLNKIDINKYHTYLLHGVTGSGKTEIYIKLIKEVLNKNKNVLILVPEISLTPQTISRFKYHFNNIIVYHSGLSDNEKYDEWRKVKRNEARISIGTRSSIFLPFTNIGLIIMDEEHDQAYFQTENIIYSTKDLAIERCKYYNCPLILGSATPSLDSYYKALNKEYELLELKTRYNNLKPQVEIIKMNEEFKNGNRKIFSNLLLKEIENRLNKNEKIILMINRRGYSNFVMCRECGYIPKCINCNVSLTYHKNTNKLKCHYCNYEIDNITTCPICHSKYIRYVGSGTEQVESEIKKLYPNIKVLRLDKDTTTKKYAYNDILNKFNNEDYNILIGTQMISKGLDFKDVTLVGVLLADLLISYPSYTSYENAYQLLTQVSGRTGRRDKQGEVIIQVYNDNNNIINLSKEEDYLKFYNYEINNRKLLKYPPFYNLVQIIIKDENKNNLNKETDFIYTILKNSLKNSIILGPNDPVINKINKYYLKNITIKYQNKLDDINKIINYLKNLYQDSKTILIFNKLPLDLKE